MKDPLDLKTFFMGAIFGVFIGCAVTLLIANNII